MLQDFNKEVLDHIKGFEQKLEENNTRLYHLEWNIYFSKEDPELKPLREKSLSIYNNLQNFKKIKDFIKRLDCGESLSSKAKNLLLKWGEDLSREILPTESLRKKALHLAEFEDNLTKDRGSFRIDIETPEGRKSLAFEETQNILRTEKNKNLRKDVWRKREKLGKILLSKGFKKLIDERNEFSREAAKELGYDNPESFNYYRLRLEQMDFDEKKLFDIFDNLKKRSDKPTKKILEKHCKENNWERIEPWDLSFITYRENRNLDSYYKLNELNNNVEETAASMGFTPKEYNLTFDLFPKEGKLDNAFLFPITPPTYVDGKYRGRGDIRLFANMIEGGIREQKTMLHEWGHLLHSCETKQEFYIFRGMQNNPSLTEGIAMLFERFALEKEFFTDILKTSDDIESLLNEAKRQESETALLELRLILSRVYFERKLYYHPEKSPASIFSEVLKDFFFVDKYDGIDAWVERPHFVSSPVYYQSYAVATLLREQFFSFLKNEFGSIVSNPKAGNHLKETCFAYGNSLKWGETVKRMIGEELNPDPFLKKISSY